MNKLNGMHMNLPIESRMIIANIIKSADFYQQYQNGFQSRTVQWTENSIIIDNDTIYFDDYENDYELFEEIDSIVNQ